MNKKLIFVTLLLAVSLFGLSAISFDEAKSIMFRHAGLSPYDSFITKSQEGRDDGWRVFEMEFINGSGKYEYEVDAQTGEILKYSYEKNRNWRPQPSPQIPMPSITENQALQIALDDSKLSRDRVMILGSHETKDNGRPVYEVSFRYQGWTFTYMIDKETGKVLDKGLN